jgi:hypothetical protein
MPNATQLITLWSPGGAQFLDFLDDFTTLECVLSEGNIGTLVLTLPSTHNYTFYRRDARVAFYRAPTAALSTGQPRLRLVGNTVWLLAGRKRTISSGKESVTLICVHPNQLLSRRIVQYSEGSAQADKSAAADDEIKAYVRENFTAATDTTRNWSSSLFTVDANTTAAPAVDKAASERTILNVCQELAAAASALGTYTNFEVIGTETGPFHLRTYTGQRGADRSSTSGQTLVLSAASGAFDTVEIEENWIDMASYVYGGGAGKGDERIITAAWDTDLINGSPYGLIEYFQNSGSDDPAVVTDDANKALRERRPRIVFTGSVNDTAAATFMEEYDWGDRVVGEYTRPDPQGQGFTDVQQFDCRVDPVRIQVRRTEDPETGEQKEQETLDIRLRHES